MSQHKFKYFKITTLLHELAMVRARGRRSFRLHLRNDAFALITAQGSRNLIPYIYIVKQKLGSQCQRVFQSQFQDLVGYSSSIIFAGS